MHLGHRLYSALKLAEKEWPRRVDPEIILIDGKDRFLFKPLMYELLTEEATLDVVAPPYSKLIDESKVWSKFQTLLLPLFISFADQGVFLPWRRHLQPTFESATFVATCLIMQITVIKSEVNQVTVASDGSGGFVTLNDKSSVNFDYVILATGSKPRLQLIPGSEKWAVPFYNLEDVDGVKAILEELAEKATPRESKATTDV